jgi:hypothetical protein
VKANLKLIATSLLLPTVSTKIIAANYEVAPPASRLAQLDQQLNDCSLPGRQPRRIAA